MLKELTVSKKYDGFVISTFLKSAVPDMNQSTFFKLLKKKDIKINGKAASMYAKVRRGDRVSLYLPSPEGNDGDKKQGYPFLCASGAVTVIFDNDNLAAVYKPAGVLTNDETNKSKDTLINRYLRYLYENGKYDPEDRNAFAPALCHRLDQGTCGLVLIAKNEAALAEMEELIRLRKIDKEYMCITVGRPPHDGVYRAFLRKDAGSGIVTVFPEERNGAQEIVTRVKLLESSGELSLVNVGLVTGRTHQIRAHLKFLGCPILGDGKYGYGQINQKYRITRQALCAYRITFPHMSREENPALVNMSGRTIELRDIWIRDYYNGNTGVKKNGKV